MKQLLKRRYVFTQDIEFCAFGTPWKKSTKFLSVHMALDLLQQYRCIGSKRGLCAFSGCPHIPLSGQDKKGNWMTKVAEPYPWKLTRLLATAFMNTDLALVATEFARHLQ